MEDINILWVDDEIDSELMCDVKPKEQKKGLFKQNPRECKTEQGGFSIDSVYGQPQDELPECDE